MQDVVMCSNRNERTTDHTDNTDGGIDLIFPIRVISVIRGRILHYLFG